MIYKHYITGLGIGGAESSLLKLILSCKSSNPYDKHIVVSLTKRLCLKKDFESLGVKVYSPNNRFCYILFLISTIYSPKMSRPDIITGWMPHGCFFSLIASLCSKESKLVWSIRQSIYNIRYESVFTQILLRLNSVLSFVPDALHYNSFTAKKTHESLGFRNSNTFVIQNWLDQRLKENNFSLREKLILSTLDNMRLKGNKIVTVLSRFHPMKDHKTFIGAIIPILDTYKDVYIVMAGNKLSFCNIQLISLIPEKYRYRFFLIDKVSCSRELLLRTTIYCQSSYTESFSNSLLEAMDSGCMCAATDVGDSRLMLGEEYCVPVRNPIQLTCLLHNLLSKTPSEVSSITQKLVSRVKVRFSQRLAEHKIVKLLHSLEVFR